MTAGVGRHDGTRTPVKDVLLERLAAGPQTSAELAGWLDVTQRFLSHKLGELEAEGRVVREGRRWALT